MEEGERKQGESGGRIQRRLHSRSARAELRTTRAGARRGFETRSSCSHLSASAKRRGRSGGASRARRRGGGSTCARRGASVTVRGCAREAVYGSSSSRKRLESSSRRGSNHGKRKRKRAWSKPAAYLTRTSKGKFAPSRAAWATATPSVLRLADCSQDSSARRRLAGHPSDVRGNTLYQSGSFSCALHDGAGFVAPQ